MGSRQLADMTKTPTVSSFPSGDSGDLNHIHSIEERANVHSTGLKRHWVVHTICLWLLLLWMDFVLGTQPLSSVLTRTFHHVKEIRIKVLFSRTNHVLDPVLRTLYIISFPSTRPILQMRKQNPEEGRWLA